MNFSPVAGSGVLFEDDRLRIRFEESLSDKEAVVSFSGIGAGAYGVRDLRGRGAATTTPTTLATEDPSPTQIDEFRKSIGGAKNVYYVTDKKRFWYNGIENKILDILNTHLTERRTKRVLALGNSMGGSAALMFASRIKECRHAIALAPQSSVHPDLVPFDNRWENYRSKITEWTTPDPAAAIEGGARRYYVFYGMDDNLDEQHIKRILARALPNVIIYGIQDCGHEAALYLRENGTSLMDMVDKACTVKPNEFRELFGKLPHKVFRAG
jgi:pimeloyl-ACP methyl ester carboxylesterase